MKNPLILIIMDGFGISKHNRKSAITAETTPYLSEFFKNYPTTLLKASGEAVGLPAGQMGNSEVGHMNIGAGRIVYQELTRINKSIKNESFYRNTTLINAILSAKKNNSALHIMGLLSDGGVHSHIEHLYALLKMAKKFEISKVYIHAFLDGRDTSPTAGKNFIKSCENEIKKLEIGKIVTIMGRYYAMDRDNRWERVKKAYDAMASGVGVYEENPIKALENFYKSGITDEFVEPTVCDKSAVINSGDSVIFFNFRPDRARQITHAMVDEDFDGFIRAKKLDNLNFVCMTRYDESILHVKVAFEAEKIENTLAEVLSKNNLTQLRIAETEKYAHVTFFFNGGIEKKYVGEDRILISSPKVATYDLKPEMSAFEVTKVVKEKVLSCEYDVIILNFANCDMVGHTGNFEATKTAVKTVDNCVHEIIQAILKVHGCALITADHGNVEKMLDEDGKIFTAHTTSPVPLCIIGNKCKLKPTGKLADIAPTILSLLNLEKLSDMTGESLIFE